MTERYLPLHSCISQGAITSIEAFDFFVRKAAGPYLIKDFEKPNLGQVTRRENGEVEV
jgi:hypothetical protein